VYDIRELVGMCLYMRDKPYAAIMSWCEKSLDYCDIILTCCFW